MIESIVIFATAFIIGIPLIHFCRWFGMRVGLVVNPRPDRWHARPTPASGGIGIFLSPLISKKPYMKNKYVNDYILKKYT